MKARLTPKSNFILPLLDALESVGGRARKGDIYRMLEKEKGLMSPADMDLIKDGWHRYRIPLNFLVADMRKAGLLETPSGDNSIRITAAGLRLIRK
jgi:hypothetical protein